MLSLLLPESDDETDKKDRWIGQKKKKYCQREKGKKKTKVVIIYLFI